MAEGRGGTSWISSPESFISSFLRPARPDERTALTVHERLLVRLLWRYVQVEKSVSFSLRLDNHELERIGAGNHLVRIALDNAAETCRRIFTGGSLELGDCYCEGLIHVADSDYRHFLLVLVRAVFDPSLRQALPLPDRIRLLGAGLRGGFFSFDEPDRNINSHYSLSDWCDEETANRFYLAWLDTRHHQYSSGLWRPGVQTVEEAQEEKFAHYAERLGIPSNARGRTLLDLGCGWGGFLFHAATRYGLSAHGVTLSTAQGQYIAAEARRRGLDHLVTVTVGDAREVSGQWDHIISIGLLEHIDCPDMLFARVSGCLLPGGTALFHAMFHEGLFYKPDPWLTRHIFPGGRVPGIHHTLRLLERRFAIVDRENLPALSYPKTLAAWHGRFCAKEQELRALLEAGGCLDVERAIRTFKHYLVLAETGLSVDGVVCNIVCREPLSERELAFAAARGWGRSEIALSAEAGP